MPDPIIVAEGTWLVIEPLSGEATPVLTPYAARNLTVKLEPIGQPLLFQRDVNGTLHDLTDDVFRKYKMTVQCRDGEAPCLNRSWLGVQVGISAPFELSYPAGDSPERPVVSGSSRTVNGFVYFRPYLQMMVTSIEDSTEEWQARHTWKLIFEEI